MFSLFICHQRTSEICHQGTSSSGFHGDFLQNTSLCYSSVTFGKKVCSDTNLPNHVWKTHTRFLFECNITQTPLKAIWGWVWSKRKRRENACHHSPQSLTGARDHTTSLHFYGNSSSCNRRSGIQSQKTTNGRIGEIGSKNAPANKCPWRGRRGPRRYGGCGSCWQNSFRGDRSFLFENLL